jgi:hypothetical protein
MLASCIPHVMATRLDDLPKRHGEWRVVAGRDVSRTHASVLQGVLHYRHRPTGLLFSGGAPLPSLVEMRSWRWRRKNESQG